MDDLFNPYYDDDPPFWAVLEQNRRTPLPPELVEASYQRLLRRMRARNTELERMVAEHIADPSKPDPRTWVL